MKSQSPHQIIPFPLPPYLATFFANKITTDQVICNDGSIAKPFNIKRNSAFGSFILNCLSSREKKNIISDEMTFFIRVNDCQTTQNKRTVNSKFCFVGLSDDSIQEIRKVFKSVFDESLMNYVAGAEDVANLYVNRERGIRKRAILHFCKKNKVIYTNQNLDAWNKMIYRANKKVNTNKTSVL